MTISEDGIVLHAFYRVASPSGWRVTVSVALFPTLRAETVRYILEHSESKLLFVGKLDAWDEIAEGVPQGMPCVAYPLAPPTHFPRWNDLIARHQPIGVEPRRKPDDWALIIYTSGSTGRPKGAVHTFASISAPTHGIVKMLGITASDHALSYLPLAHAMDRWASECTSLVAGYRIYFAESLETFVEDLKRVPLLSERPLAAGPSLASAAECYPLQGAHAPCQRSFEPKSVHRASCQKTPYRTRNAGGPACPLRCASI